MRAMVFDLRFIPKNQGLSTCSSHVCITPVPAGTLIPLPSLLWVCRFERALKSHFTNGGTRTKEMCTCQGKQYLPLSTSALKKYLFALLLATVLHACHDHEWSWSEWRNRSLGWVVMPEYICDLKIILVSMWSMENVRFASLVPPFLKGALVRQLEIVPKNLVLSMEQLGLQGLFGWSAIWMSMGRCPSRISLP